MASEKTQGFDHETDVVIVGSGAAATITALSVKEGGLEPLMVEATDMLGGNSAISGGGVWIPNNAVMKRKGIQDSYDSAKQYIDLAIDRAGTPGPGSSPARRHAFLTRGPEMISWLESLGMKWVLAKNYPDYYPNMPGGTVNGRALEGKFYNIRRLGKTADKLRYTVRAIPVHTFYASRLAVVFRSFRSLLTALNIIVVKTALQRLIGRKLVGLGNALMGRLMEMAVKRNIPMWLSSPMTDLIVENGKVVGVVVVRDGKAIKIGARKAVVLASGGFEKNDEMRKRYQENPIGASWTSGSPGNMGVPIEAAKRAGASIDLMNEAWWGPTVLMPPNDTPMFLLQERSLPFSFIVAKDGKRFMNESESYVDAGHHMYERNRTVPAVPAWLIMDTHHRSYYPFGIGLPGKSGSKKLVKAGMLIEAPTLEELAKKIGVDPAGLVETARRFNGFAMTGKDLDFQRGDTAYDRFYSDPKVKPNPNLAAVDKAPFYAVKVYPGDLGTKGGVVTDEHARALREDGTVIEGLYAAGNCSASVMGRTYPGPGSTLGPALTFGYVAGRDITGKS